MASNAPVEFTDVRRPGLSGPAAGGPERSALRRIAALALAAAVLWLLAGRQAATESQAAPYFPPRGAWEAREPASLGLDKAKLDEAIAFAVANEATTDKDLAVSTPRQFSSEAPYNNLLGPTEPRTGSNGVVIRHGYVAAQWGDTAKADMTFSVTKTFLSTVVGEAVERKLIRNVQDRVAPYMPAGVDLFTSEHNAPITWEHLLRQTSDWSGTLWDKPDWADRPPSGQTPEQWPNRTMYAPGAHYKYNDTRVNVLSLATLYLLKEPLPTVLKREIMDPIGASTSWHWEPYRNAYVTIDGKRLPSVPGGGHHGGGMFINSVDMARFGYLFLHNGKWGTRQLVTEAWIAQAKTPGPANTAYGYMNWFLNTPSPTENDRPSRQMYPAAPASAVAFRGNGENLVYIDWDNDMVVVVRWLGRGANDFFGKVIASIVK